MFRTSILLPTLGLAIHLALWSVPALVAGSVLPHALLADTTSTLTSLAVPARTSPNMIDGLIQLIDAEFEALHVAGAALQQPTPTDIGPTATAAGARVLAATAQYVQAARVALDSLPR